jgi:hypothetical protein
VAREVVTAGLPSSFKEVVGLPGRIDVFVWPFFCLRGPRGRPRLYRLHRSARERQTITRVETEVLATLVPHIANGVIGLKMNVTFWVDSGRSA